MSHSDIKKNKGLKCKNSHVIVTKVQIYPCKIFWSKTAHQISKLRQKCPSQLIFLTHHFLSIHLSLKHVTNLYIYLPLCDDDATEDDE